MTREETYNKINHVIANGRNKNATLLDVLFYKKGTATKVVVVEHRAYSALGDSIDAYEARSPSEALARAIGRHAHHDEMKADHSSNIGTANARIESL